MITVAMISTAMTMTIAQEVPHFCHHVVFFNSNCSGGSPHEGKRRELNRERDLVPQKRWQCQPRYDRNHHNDIHQCVRHDHHQCGLMIIIEGAEEEEASV